MERKLPKRQRRRYSELKVYERSPTNTSESSLFIPATIYPSFFDQNLLDEDRQIKVFKDDLHTHETIFYFQLFKLIFECEDSHYEKYLQKIYDLLDNPEFELLTPKLGSAYCLGLSSPKMKKLITEFLEEMGEGELGVEEGLRKYPIVHKLMVIFFRSVLLAADQCSSFQEEVEAAELYELLGSYFELEITYYGNCLRFNQVDVFVYLHDNSEVYLAYISPQSQQDILSSSQLYQIDPAEAFNISSVKQMVSEIDIPVDTDCFNSSKRHDNLDDTQEIDYNYSQSEDVRAPSRSLQEPSELKFSYLINDDSIQNLNVIKSNKILEKEVIGEKRNLGPTRFAPQIDCYQIEEAPPQLENAVSPMVTPRETKFVAFNSEQCRKFDQANIYRRKKSGNIRDIIKEEYQRLSTYESGFKKRQFEDVLVDTADTDWGFKREGPAFLEEIEANKPTVTLRSLYDGKSIKSICASDAGESYLIGQTPAKISKLSSRTHTIQNKLQENIEPSRSKNTSGDFTSSFVLRQMKEPFQSNIRSMKMRARESRQNVRKVILF